MIRSLAFLAMSFWACAAGQAQSTNNEIRLRATVQTVILLTRFSGTITPVDFDPRFALTLHIESAVPEVDRFRADAVVALAIHSPSLTFREEPKEGKVYDFVLHRKTQDGKVRFFGLKVQDPSAFRASVGKQAGTPQGQPEPQESKPSTRVKLPRYMTDIPQPIPDELKLPDAPTTRRELTCFRAFNNKASMVDVVRKCGIPDDHQGSGIAIFIYKMSDGSVVAVGTGGDMKSLLYVDHITKDGGSHLLKTDHAP